MNFTSALRAAGRTLSRRRVRALLLSLGVLLGVMLLTLLGSVGEGTRRVTVSRFRNMLGSFDSVIVRPGAANSRGMVSVANTPATLTHDDATAIAAVASVKQTVEVENVLGADLSWRDRHETSGLFGVSPNWASARGDVVVEGDFLDEADARAQARVAVLGADLRTRLFGSGPALGQTIRVGQVPFVVKGVLAPRGAGPTGATLDNEAYVPLSTAANRVFNRPYLTMIIAQLRDPRLDKSTSRDIRALLRDRHHLAAGVADDFTLTSPRAVMGRISSFGSMLARMLTLAAILVLGLGGLVIMILMLLGVADRRREIGLKRALGATRRAILAEFLAEAVILSVAGGVGGVGLGLLATQVVSAWQRLPLAINLPVALGALVLALAVGLASGIAPAMRAARTDPALALRD